MCYVLLGHFFFNWILLFSVLNFIDFMERNIEFYVLVLLFDLIKFFCDWLILNLFV